MSSAIRYRRDVDGLRALAVVPILLFHLGSTWVPGGFVGVDIFFVISGFLIGGICLAELDAGRFSFRAFWLRRVRRILPALTATLLATSAAALWLLLPPDLVRYGRSLVASALSVANLYFARTAGYFDANAADSPLLHLWSLGVEEQFYLLFPPTLWALHRWARRLLPAAVAAGGLLSFALSAWLVGRGSNMAFFTLPSRAWELLLGLGVTLLPARSWRSGAAREGVAALGLAAMLLAIFRYDATTPFPGWSAAMPCLGAAAVIAAGVSGPTLVSRALQWRPLVATGLVSFSLYLWHWPLIVLARYALPAPDLSPAARLGLLAATGALAILSWRFVERPFRALRPRPAVAFGVAAAAVAVLALAGTALIAARGLPARLTPEAARIAAWLDYPSAAAFREGRCFLSRGEPGEAVVDAGCVTPAAGRRNVLLLGNSHAAHLWAGLARVAPEANVMQGTAAGWGCAPVIDLAESPTCDSLWRAMYGPAIGDGHVDLVVISATWEERALRPLARTLAMLHARGIPALLVAPGPQYAIPLPRLLAFAIARGDPRLPERFAVASPRRFDADLRRIAAANGAGFLSAYAALCPGGRCPATIDGAPLLFDTDHMTTLAAARLGRAIVAAPVWRARTPVSPSLP